MRYEDASHTGAFQGSQPVANDDLDSIPAGSRTPATGNLISGEGTQTGSAGADVAPGAHVAAIAGKGGEDTSFSGGKLSVAGEYGHLSVDKDGNYSYQANKGVENVRDRFTYTLADNNGATDTGALIVEIGKTPVVIKAGAQQIVPGPDGVVTLPPGVELSDIMVVGRNLVINMPDGTQMIIVDGAIFVPQLQLGGVEVPATNLAALLIGQEPQPAAGEAAQSSGGNFATPVPPLDPGVPLGDLIPPTEYVYQPPEPQPPLLPLENDEVPTIQIQPDGQPASVNAVDSVDEDGLPTRNGGEPEGSDEGADGNPSNNSDTDETTAGTIIVDSPDGVGSVTINGVLVTGAIGQVINGEFGTLTITGFNGSNILYSYTLTDNTSGDNTHDDFTVVLTDPDGDTATATLTIDIIDDVPTARDDTDAVVKGETSTDGNVLTGVGTTSGSAGSDTPGADALPNGVTGIQAGTSGSFTSVTSGGVLVHGTFGDLLIHADGSYTYTSNGQPGPGGNDVFTYQVTDGDGDVDTATLTITVPPDSIPVANNATALVDDDGLPLGNHDSAPGDDTQSPDPDSDESTFGGTLTANFGTDGPGTFTFSSDMDGKVVTIGQEEVTYHLVGNVLTAEVSDGARSGTDLFTVTLNADGTYSVQLINNVLQLDDGTNTENNASASITFTAHDSDGDVGNGTLTITLDDDIPVAKPPIPPEEGGDPTPLVTGLVDEDDLPAGNGDNAPGDDDPGNADGDNDGTTTGGGAGSLGGLFNAGADAPLTFSLSSVTSGLPVLHSAGALVTYDVSGNVLTASANGSTVFTLTVNADGSWVFDLEGQLDHPTAGTEDNLLLDLSSVIVATDTDGDEVGAAGGVFVINVDDDMPSQGEGSVVAHVDEDELSGGITDSDAETTVATGSLASQVSIGADQPGSFSFDGSALGGLPALTSGGNAIHYAIVGDSLVAYTGADPALNQVFTVSLDSDGNFTVTLLDQVDHLPNSPANDDDQSLTIDLSGIVQVIDADGDSVNLDARSFIVDLEDDIPVANDDGANAVEGTTLNVATSLLANDSFGADGPEGGTPHVTSVTHGATTVSVPNGSGDLVIAGTYGTLTIHADGTYSYLAAQGSIPPAGATETFSYLITDGDTDTDTATLTINVANNGLTPIAGTVNAFVDDEGLAGGILGGTGDINANSGEVGSGTSSEAIWTGTLQGSGGDAPISFRFAASLDGTSVNVGTESATYAVSADGLTLTATGPRGLLFTVHIDNAATGAYTLTLNDNVLNTFGDNTEASATVDIPYTVNDIDSSVTGTIHATFNDDTPTLSNVQAGAGVDVDETDAGSPAGFPISDTSVGAVITATQAFGADGAAAANSVVYGLAINGGAGSGLQTAIGNFAITLVQIDGNTIQGQYNGANVAFTIDIASDGKVTLTQNVPLEHNTDGNTPADYNDTLNLAGHINATITITDGDGDSTSASAPIGGNLVFFDDGPDAQVNGQATLDQLVLDETRPVGQDSDSGDNSPGGLATTTANFADNFVSPVDYGADGAGTTAYSLLLSANGIGSGLYALDNTDMSAGDGDGYGQGALITLSQVGNLITGSANGLDYFTISINSATGEVTFTQIRNVWHSNTASDDETATLTTAAAANIQVVQTVTDSDGDFDTAGINVGQGVFHIEDDGPEILAVDNTLNIDNVGTPSGTGAFDFDIGTDSPNGGSGNQNPDDISVSNFAISVNGSPASNVVLTPGAENAATANYSFSFDYDTGAGGVDHATGTLVFDKAAGTYTVELDSGPIAGFTIVQTSDLTTTFDEYDLNGGAPDVVVATLGENLFAQFVAVSTNNNGTPHLLTTVGNNTAWNPGELFTADPGNPQVSHTDAGVDGNTMDTGEVLDFNLYSADPGSDTTPAVPVTSATDMFIQFFQYAGDDLIVVLKLGADTNDDGVLDTFTTRAVIVDPTDLFYDSDSAPGTPYAGLVTALGSQDALLVIESNDYNAAGENWVITGAQIVTDEDGTSGSGINLVGGLGAAGASDTNGDGSFAGGETQAFSTDTDTSGVKITSIGFLVQDTTDQSATIDFDVTIHDADGDTQTESITVNIGDPVAPLAALSAMSQEQQLQKTAANSNTLALAAAVAAAGVVETQAAAAPAHDNGNHGHQVEDIVSNISQHVVVASSSADSGSSVVSDEAPEATNASAPVDSSSHHSAPEKSDHALDDSSPKGAAESNDHPAAANDQGPVQVSADASPVAPTVAMVSAEALQAAGVAGNAHQAAGVAGHGQHGGSVEQIVAEALGHGHASATVDALLNALPGGNGAVAALANVASPPANAVPGGDMLGLGAFAPGHDMMTNMHVAMHHDAVQPVANG